MAKRKKASTKDKFFTRWHASPLKGSFMVLAMLGVLITVYLVDDVNYKITFMLVFAAMFIASLISMTKAPVVE